MKFHTSNIEHDFALFEFWAVEIENAETYGYFSAEAVEYASSYLYCITGCTDCQRRWDGSPADHALLKISHAFRDAVATNDVITADDLHAQIASMIGYGA